MLNRKERRKLNRGNMSPTVTDPTATFRLAVYGTLRKGRGNWSHYLNRDPLEVTRTPPGYRLHLKGLLPFVTCRPDLNESVVVEVYEVTRDELAHIDMLEGHPNWYRRAMVKLASGTMAFLYLVPNTPDVAGCGYITNGDYIRAMEDMADARLLNQ